MGKDGERSERGRERWGRKEELERRGQDALGEGERESQEKKVDKR